MFDCSAVVNVHRERVLLWPTLRSLALAKSRAEEKGGRVEIVIVADNPDEKTLEICRSWGQADAIYVVEKGDLGLSRSFGIEKCTSQWVFLHDGDDLYSSNIYSKFIEMKRGNRIKPNRVYHTEYFMKFGGENETRRMIASNDPLFDPMYLVYDWFFSNKCVIDRGILELFPIPHNDKITGIGNEDWSWAGDTIAGGIIHDILPRTTCYYRVKEHHLSLGLVPSMTQGASPLYSQSFINNQLRAANEIKVDILDFSTQLQMPLDVFEAMQEQIDFEPLISNNMRGSHWAMTSTLRSILRRAADGAAEVLGALDERKKIVLFVSDRNRHQIQRILRLMERLQSSWRPETHQLIVFHDTNTPLFTRTSLGDSWGTVYLTTSRLKNDFGIPDWFRYALPIRILVQHPGAILIDMGSETFKGLCERFYKVVVSQCKRIFLTQAQLVVDPILGLPQRRAQIRRLLSKSDLYRDNRVHVIDFFGLGGVSGGYSEPGLKLEASTDFARATFLASITMRDIVYIPRPNWTITRPSTPKKNVFTITEPVESVLVQGTGRLSKRFVESAQRHAINFNGPCIILAQTVQHRDPLSNVYYMRWYDFSNARGVIEEITDRLRRGHEVAVAGVIFGRALIEQYAKSGSLLELLHHLLEVDQEEKIITLPRDETGLALLSTASNPAEEVQLVESAIAHWQQPDGGETATARELVRLFGVIFTASDYITSVLDAHSEEQIYNYLANWEPRKKAIVEQGTEPISDSLLVETFSEDAKVWAESIWLPVTRFLRGPQKLIAANEKLRAYSCEKSSLLPSALQDLIEILATFPEAYVPSPNFSVQWRGPENHNRYVLFERLKEIGRKLFGGHFVMLPFLESGGAELVGTLHLQSWLEAGHKNSRIILTERPTIVQNYAHMEAHTINLPQIVSEVTGLRYPEDFSLEDRQSFLEELLRAAQPQRIFSVQSYTTSLLLSATKPARWVEYAMFCPHIDTMGRISGFQNMISAMDGNIDVYLSDNTVYAKKVCEDYCIGRDRIHTFFYPPDPVRLQPLNGRRFGDQKSRNVLWASRIDYQKNPEVVAAVAESMPELTFHMYGRRVMNDVDFDPLSLPANVIYHGEFNSLDQLMERNYLCFMYTSRFDGMPNVLLEMAASGLPVITPNVGGIADFFGDSWPGFIRDPEDYKAYQEALMSIQDPARYNDMLRHQDAALMQRSRNALFTDINEYGFGGLQRYAALPLQDGSSHSNLGESHD